MTLSRGLTVDIIGSEAWGRAQALHHGAAAALWERALGLGITAVPSSPPSPLDGVGVEDRLAYVAAMALGDLFVFRGDDTVAAAVLLVALDQRGVARSGALLHASRPLRLAAAWAYLLSRLMYSSCSSLGVIDGGPPPPKAACDRTLARQLLAAPNKSSVSWV